MATSKPIAAISYNTDEYLQSVLNDLLQSGILLQWSYIHHDPDTDDKTKHIHLRVIPNKAIDLKALQDIFIQPVHDNKPLRTLRFDYSKEYDWILYVLHNVEYLKLKKKTRNKHYAFQDFISSDIEDLEYRYREALEWLNQAIQDDKIDDELRSGVSLRQLADDGLVNSRNAFKVKTYNDILHSAHISKKYEDVVKLQEEVQQTLDSVRQSKLEADLKLKEANKLYHENLKLHEKLNMQLDFDNPFMGVI